MTQKEIMGKSSEELITELKRRDISLLDYCDDYDICLEYVNRGLQDNDDNYQLGRTSDSDILDECISRGFDLADNLTHDLQERCNTIFIGLQCKMNVDREIVSLIEDITKKRIKHEYKFGN